MAKHINCRRDDEHLSSSAAVRVLAVPPRSLAREVLHSLDTLDLRAGSHHSVTFPIDRYRLLYQLNRSTYADASQHAAKLFTETQQYVDSNSDSSAKLKQDRPCTLQGRSCLTLLHALIQRSDEALGSLRRRPTTPAAECPCCLGQPLRC